MQEACNVTNVISIFKAQLYMPEPRQVCSDVTWGDRKLYHWQGRCSDSPFQHTKAIALDIHENLDTTSNSFGGPKFSWTNPMSTVTMQYFMSEAFSSCSQPSRLILHDSESSVLDLAMAGSGGIGGGSVPGTLEWVSSSFESLGRLPSNQKYTVGVPSLLRLSFVDSKEGNCSVPNGQQDISPPASGIFHKYVYKSSMTWWPIL